MALKWPADWIIINIEGGADWLRICKTKFFFLGCGMIKFWYGIYMVLVKPTHKPVVTKD
jgi:hypothetical protein